MSGEISYDLVMTDDMGFVEGCYRLPGGEWCVVVVSRGDVREPEAATQVWDSGVGGLIVQFPRQGALNAAAVERVLTTTLGVSEWVRVRGPDSLQIR